MICHAVEARRHDEAEHGIETGRIVMTPEGGYAEIREQVASRRWLARKSAVSSFESVRSCRRGLWKV